MGCAFLFWPNETSFVYIVYQSFSTFFIHFDYEHIETLYRDKSVMLPHLLHGELPLKRRGGEHLLNEIFYAGNDKWLNAFQFLQAEEEYKYR